MVIGDKTDAVSTMHLHPILSSTALTDLPNFSPVKSLMQSSYSLLLVHFTVLCRIVLVMSEALEIYMTVPSEFTLRHYMKEIAMLADCILDHITNILISHMVALHDLERLRFKWWSKF